ncbi:MULTISPECIES: hypothetical protein [unclassified Phenylobacterium]|uniref:hypothetical protein n=1 Tax=unclassified Phenylobacterium TaxID=2640670 RepID=UPI0012E337B6|nr:MULTISPECIES: hypothetical protein [unclassified Phenylobacterium]
MNRFLSGLCVIVGFVSATSAGAADLYATVSYAHLSQDLRDTQLGAVQGRLGARFTPYVGLEGEAAFGVSGDDWSLGMLPPDTTSAPALK